MLYVWLKDREQQNSIRTLEKHWDACLGDRSFSVAGLWLWNSLPAELRQPDGEIGHLSV